MIEALKEGIDDQDIWELVKSEKRLLVTTDKGFAQRRNEAHSGILIVCLRQPNRTKIHQRVIEGMDRFSEEQWVGKTLIMRDRVQSLWQFKWE